jgi:hypothetical protein
MLTPKNNRHIPLIKKVPALSVPKRNGEYIDSFSVDVDCYSVSSLCLSETETTEMDAVTIIEDDLETAGKESNDNHLDVGTASDVSIHIREPSIGELTQEEILGRGISQLLNIDPSFAKDFMDSLPIDIGSPRSSMRMTCSPRSNTSTPRSASNTPR